MQFCPLPSPVMSTFSNARLTQWYWNMKGSSMYRIFSTYEAPNNRLRFSKTLTPKTSGLFVDSG